MNLSREEYEIIEKILTISKNQQGVPELIALLDALKTFDASKGDTPLSLSLKDIVDIANLYNSTLATASEDEAREATGATEGELQSIGQKLRGFAQQGLDAAAHHQY